MNTVFRAPLSHDILYQGLTTPQTQTFPLQWKSTMNTGYCHRRKCPPSQWPCSIADVPTTIGSWCFVTVLPLFLKKQSAFTLPTSPGGQGWTRRMALTVEASGNQLVTFPLWSDHHIRPSIRMWGMWTMQCGHSGVLGVWCLQGQSTGAEVAGNVQRKRERCAYFIFLICEEYGDDWVRPTFREDGTLSPCASRTAGGNKEHLVFLEAVSRSYSLMHPRLQQLLSGLSSACPSSSHPGEPWEGLFMGSLSHILPFSFLHSQLSFCSLELCCRNYFHLYL